MKIYLDFDGTVVEHEFPRMGRCNFGCFEVIKKLQDAGHEIILNTYRADIGKPELDAALRLINDFHWRFVRDKQLHGEFEIRPIQATENKIHPDVFDMDEARRTGILFIDDMAAGTPLKDACMTNGKMVDWDELDAIFEVQGMYKTVLTNQQCNSQEQS